MIYSRLRDLCYETWPKLSKNRRRPENAPGCTLRGFFGKVVFDRFLMRLKTEGGLKPRAAYISSQAYQLRVNTEGGLIPRAT